MNIVFRVDSSSQIGSGHVIRCLTLAEELRKNNHKVIFIIRDLEGNLYNLIISKGYQAIMLNSTVEEPCTWDLKHSSWLKVSQKSDAEDTIKVMENLPKVDWVVVDHYGIDFRWEKNIKSHTDNIMIIDDLADRQHSCDMILDQNFYYNTEYRYSNLLPLYNKKLLGPKYALLRDEITEKSPRVRTHINNILVFMGGTDPQNETEKIIRALEEFNKSVKVNVVVGIANPYKEQIRQICDKNELLTYHCQVDYMGELLTEADLAIGAGGSTTWERSYLGLPTIVLSIAENQLQISRDVSTYGAIKYIGKSQEISKKTIHDTISWFSQDLNRIKNMSKKAQTLVDGKGVERVVRAMSRLNSLIITIATDNNTWMNNYILDFINKQKDDGHQVQWIHDINEISEGDIAFFLSFEKVVPKYILNKNRNNIVVHASDLPSGKGWSPLTWQILEGKNSIPLSLFEASEKVDTGQVYLKDYLEFEGYELINELRYKLGLKILEMCNEFIQEYPVITKQGEEQLGEESFYNKRTQTDSELDINKTIKEQFNLLRVVDNKKYPAYFQINGHKYTLKVYREE